MTFGITAVQAIAVAAAAGAVAYGADSQRKAVHGQQDAISEARSQDARNAANAETQAQIDANARTAEARRRRRNSVLGGGDQTTDLLGGGDVSSPGNSALATRSAQLVAGIGSRYGSALGAGGGSSAVSAPRAYVPARPSRESAV